MEIGIDATCWWNRRGFGRFTRELLKALFAHPAGHRYRLFVDQAPEPAMGHPQVEVVQVASERPVTAAAVADGNRSLASVWRLAQAVAAHRPDVMFFPAVYSWFPVPRRIPSVVTLHDAIAEHFPELVFPDRRRRALWSLKVRLARLQAHRLLTVSEAARNEIVRYLAIPRSRIDVICEGADDRFRPVADLARRRAARRRAGLPGGKPLILYVGALAPHKNLGNLLEGFALGRAREPALAEVHLALVGDPEGGGFHSNHAELRSRVVGDCRLRDHVHFTGFVDDDDLPALYSDALAAVMPSISEGFGLPTLEAMACGAPVLTSDVGAAPEVAGSAGLTFDPFAPESIGAAIERIATEPATRAHLASEASRRAREYSWAKAARLTVATLERCAGGG